MKKSGVISIGLLTLSAIYLAAWPAPNLFYAAVVLLHVGLGVLVSLVAVRYLPRLFKQPAFTRAAWILFALGALIGLVLIFTGTTRPFKYVYLAHILFSVVAIAMLASWWLRRRGG